MKKRTKKTEKFKPDTGTTGARLIGSLRELRDRLRENKVNSTPFVAAMKLATNDGTVQSWVCPRCGTAHPITVTECCKSPFPPPRTAHRWQFSPAESPSECLHDNCPGCKNGTCSGVHMISCPCPQCTPRF